MAGAIRREVMIGDCRMILGDCLEVLPIIGAVDGVVTSPPFNQMNHSLEGSGMHKGNAWVAKSGDGYASHSDDMDEGHYQEWMREVFRECQKICRGLVWINHKTRFRDKVGIHPLHIFDGPIYSEIVWDRGGSMTLNAKKFAPSHEFFYGFGAPHYWDNSCNTMMSVWRVAPQPFKGHPCPYPVQLVAPIIKASVPPHGIVADPFAGSGTTAVACVALGRSFVGIEKDEGYFNIACDRIRKAYAQPDFFVSPRDPEPVQQPLFTSEAAE